MAGEALPTNHRNVISARQQPRAILGSNPMIHFRQAAIHSTIHNLDFSFDFFFFFCLPSLPRQQTKRQAQPLALPHSLQPQRPSTNQVASRPAEKQDRLTGERGGGRQVRTQRHQMFKNQLRVQERAARWEDEELRRSRARRHEDVAH